AAARRAEVRGDCELRQLRQDGAALGLDRLRLYRSGADLRLDERRLASCQPSLPVLEAAESLLEVLFSVPQPRSLAVDLGGALHQQLPSFLVLLANRDQLVALRLDRLRGLRQGELPLLESRYAREQRFALLLEHPHAADELELVLGLRLRRAGRQRRQRLRKGR